MKNNSFTKSKWALVVFLLSCMTQLSAQTFAFSANKTRQNPIEKLTETTARLSFNNTVVVDVLHNLESQFSIHFLYRENNFDKKQVFSLDMGDYTLNMVLDKMSKAFNLKYKLVGSIVSLAYDENAAKKNELAPTDVQSITGMVKDAKTNEPIVGANIVVKGTQKGATTDVSGNFSLDAKEGDILVISYIGYIAKEVKVSSETNYIIKLEEQASLLSEVAVVGSRGKPRTDVNRAVPVDVINAKELQMTGQVDLGQMAQFTSPSFNSAKYGINGVANYADPATLRGMSPDQVLVLVNGKRRHQLDRLPTRWLRRRSNQPASAGSLPETRCPHA